nr:methyltransferase [Cellulosimicrobium sp. MM]
MPRPETETVAQVAIDEAARLLGDPGRADRPPLVVDLCCGSGVIGISVDVEVPGSRVVAVDLSPDAVRATTANAARVGSGTQRTLVGDVGDPALLAELDGTVDVVVSNPPYIPPDAVPVDPEVRDHDPDLALYGRGADGLEVPRAVVRAAAAPAAARRPVRHGARGGAGRRRARGRPRRGRVRRGAHPDGPHGPRPHGRGTTSRCHR